MNSRIREAICLKTQPVAVIQTDHLPPDAQGWETEHHGCILPRLEDAAEGKTVVVFQAHQRMPVRAAELGWGLRNCLLTRWRNFSRKERRDMAAWRIKRRLI